MRTRSRLFLALLMACAVAAAVVAVGLSGEDERAVAPAAVERDLRAAARHGGDPIADVDCNHTEDGAHHFFCDGELVTGQHFGLRVEDQPGRALVVRGPGLP